MDNRNQKRQAKSNTSPKCNTTLHTLDGHIYIPLDTRASIDSSNSDFGTLACDDDDENDDDDDDDDDDGNDNKHSYFIFQALFLPFSQVRSKSAGTSPDGRQ